MCDAPRRMLPGVAGRRDAHARRAARGDRTRAVASSTSSISISPRDPIAAALAAALRLAPKLEIIIVLNQNPDLTAYRALAERAARPSVRCWRIRAWACSRCGARHASRITPASTAHQPALHPQQSDRSSMMRGQRRAHRISMECRWATTAMTSQARWVARVFRGVRNVEVNVIINARDAHDVSRGRNRPVVREEEARTIRELRERLWHEHLGMARDGTAQAAGGWLAGSCGARRQRRTCERFPRARDHPTMIGRVLPYSTRAYPGEQLTELGVRPAARAPSSSATTPRGSACISSPHWIRNIF